MKRLGKNRLVLLMLALVIPVLSVAKGEHRVREALFDLHTQGSVSVLLNYIPDSQYQMSWRNQRQSLAYVYTLSAIDFGVPELALSMRFDEKVDDVPTKLAHVQFLLDSNDAETAERLLNTIKRYPSTAMKNRAYYLRVLMYLNTARLPQAIKTLNEWSGASTLKIMQAMNLSNELAQQQNVAKAIQVLNSVASELPKGGEFEQALVNRFNLYLGTFYNWQGKPNKSKQLLSKVSLNSPSAKRALLTLGWSDIGLKQPSKALAPWGYISQKNAASRAVQESWLLEPYALTRVKAYAKAADKYAVAAQKYQQQLKQVSFLVQKVRSGDWVKRTLEGSSKNISPSSLASQQRVYGNQYVNYFDDILIQTDVVHVIQKLQKLKQLQVQLTASAPQVKRSQDFYQIQKKTRQLTRSYKQWLTKYALQVLIREQTRLKNQKVKAEFLMAESYQRMALEVR